MLATAFANTLQGDAAGESPLTRVWGTLSPRFEHVDDQHFVVQGRDRLLNLSPEGLQFVGDEASISLRFRGAKKGTGPEGREKLPTRTNYLVGKDPGSWRTGVPNYSSVVYRDLYDGIDLVVHSEQDKVEYDFHVRPGADSSSIELAVLGAEETLIDGNGDLILSRPGFRLVQRKPLAYQMSDGSRRRVDVAFERRGENDVGFRLDAYDVTKPLVIDPVVYSSFLGPSFPLAMVVDEQGAAYVVGITQSTAFPATEGSLQPEFAGGVCVGLGIRGPAQSFPCYDIFLAKMNPEGTALEYATYLGAQGFDQAVDVAVDASGNAYVLAQAAPGLPTTEGALQPESPGDFAGYVAKIDPAGEKLVFATYLPGSGSEQPAAIAVDTAGSIYVTGTTLSSQFPTTPGVFQRQWRGKGPNNLGGDAFLVKINPDTGELVYSTFLGGSLSDNALDLGVDAEGYAYISGWTQSMDFPTTPGVLQATLPEGATQAAFVAKVSPQADALIYSTFLSGASYETSLAVDATGHVYVAGTVTSEDFPFTPGALLTSSDGFLVKLAPYGAEFVYAAQVGGYNSALAIDEKGSAYLAGEIQSRPGMEFEPTPGAVQSCGDTISGFAAKVSADGAQLLYATFLDYGGSITAVGAGKDGSIYVAGQSDLRKFPLTPGAFRESPIGAETNGFLAKINPSSGSRFYASQVRNSASYLQGGVAPGEWITLFNPGVGPEVPEIASMRPAQRGVTELGRVRVLFDGRAGYLTYTHRCQVNAIVPFEVAGQESVDITVEYSGVALDPVTVPVVDASPALYSRDASGYGAAAALNEDLSVNLNTPEQTAPRGSIVSLFGTGAGQMDPPLEDGLPAASPLPSVRLPVAVLYMDPTTEEFREAVVTYAGAAPDLLAGILQVNFQVPSDIELPETGYPAGIYQYALPVRLRIGDYESQTLTVWVSE
jgi:uncharacterized protein (TIGR03437 family)